MKELSYPAGADLDASNQLVVLSMAKNGALIISVCPVIFQGAVENLGGFREATRIGSCRINAGIEPSLRALYWPWSEDRMS